MMVCGLASTAQVENMGVAILLTGTKLKRLPKFRRTVVSRMHGDTTAEAPRVIQKSERKHPPDAATAHRGADVETPHPQRFRQGGFDGHATNANECFAGKGAEQPFAVTREADVASCPLIDKPADMEMAFLPGVVRKSRHRLRQTITEDANIDRHGSRRPEPTSGAASPQPARRPARRSRPHRGPCRGPYVSPAPSSPR